MKERLLERKQCACEIPDPVMQADGRFYCYRCSFQIPAVLCKDCQSIVLVRGGSAPVSATDEPLMLNSYGRRCYDAGRESAKAEAEAHATALIAQITALRDQWREHAQHLKSSPEYRLNVSATIAGVGWLLECASKLDTLLSGSAEKTTP